MFEYEIISNIYEYYESKIQDEDKKNNENQQKDNNTSGNILDNNKHNDNKNIIDLLSDNLIFYLLI